MKEIKERAFFYWGLESVKIPEGVTSISKEAFANCELLTEIELPASVKTIAPSFIQLSYLVDKIKISKQNPYFQVKGNAIVSKDGTYLVRGFGYEIPSFKIPSGVKIIGKSAFELTGGGKIVLPEGVTEIQENAFAFSECQQVILPKSLKIIGKRAFRGCKIDLSLPDGLKSIGDEAFRGSANNLTIPASVTSIGRQAFARESTLQFLGKNPPKIKSISENYSGKMTKIYVPNNKKSLYAKALKNKVPYKNIVGVKKKELKASSGKAGTNRYIILHIYGDNPYGYRYKMSGGKYSSTFKYPALKKGKTYTVYARKDGKTLKTKVTIR